MAASGLAALVSVTAAAARGPAVALNHFYVVVDAPTYEAARTSPFLTREFAPFEARTTVRNDKSYTGIYWYGRRTYFELFEPGEQGPAGASGLALGVEEPDASALVTGRWEDALGTAGGGLVTRKTETDEVPWFEMTYAREIPGLRVWLMEYHRDFLARWYGTLTTARSITRADVLDRYVAKIGQSDRRDTALLKDVTALTIALAPAERETLVKQLRAVGWTATDEAEAVVCRGPESERLRLVTPADAGTGIVEVEFSLQHAVPKTAHAIGSAELRLEGESARLLLAQPLKRAGSTSPTALGTAVSTPVPPRRRPRTRAPGPSSGPRARVPGSGSRSARFRACARAKRMCGRNGWLFRIVVLLGPAACRSNTDPAEGFTAEEAARRRRYTARGAPSRAAGPCGGTAPRGRRGPASPAGTPRSRRTP